MKSAGTILVIEDDQDIRVSYSEILEPFNFLIHSATNGQDALLLLKKLHKLPDLIILDLNMPTMSGEEFIFFKNQDSRIKEIPVIIVSCNEPLSQSDIPFLKKPLDLETFTEAILKHLPSGAP